MKNSKSIKEMISPMTTFISQNQDQLKRHTNSKRTILARNSMLIKRTTQGLPMELLQLMLVQDLDNQWITSTITIILSITIIMRTLHKTSTSNHNNLATSLTNSSTIHQAGCHSKHQEFHSNLDNIKCIICLLRICQPSQTTITLFTRKPNHTGIDLHKDITITSMNNLTWSTPRSNQSQKWEASRQTGTAECHQHFIEEHQTTQGWALLTKEKDQEATSRRELPIRLSTSSTRPWLRWFKGRTMNSSHSSTDTMDIRNHL